MEQLNAVHCVQECLSVAATERKVTFASLHVDPANFAAVQLYAGMGFTEDCLLEDYYAVGRPALKMNLNISS